MAAESTAIVAALSPRTPALRDRVAAASARIGPLEVAIALGAALTAVAGTIGADARWLDALGRIIARRGSIPNDIPWASAPSAGWHNVPVLAELVFRGLIVAGGDRGLLAAQVIAVGAALGILARDLRREGADEFAGALVLLIVVLGSLSVFVVVRSQLFSVLLFPVLIALLRADARSAGRRIWLLVPFFTLWSNLHGAVLVGLAVAVAYLVFGRGPRDPWLCAGVLASSTLAICATPAFQHTPDYYYGLLRNEAARRGEGLWAPLSLTSGFDLLLIAAAITLLVLAFRARPALWETIALLGLVVLTGKTARSGVWLLFLAAAPAAKSLRFEREGRLRVAVPLVLTAGVLAVFGLARGPVSTGAGGRLLDKAIRMAGGTPILAEGIPAEQIAADQGRVWLSNPLDAFRRRDQRLYLDWLAGRPSGDRALEDTRVVVVIRGQKPAGRLRHSHVFRQVAHDTNAVVYVRR